LIAGAGGLPPFALGARLSSGGRSIIALCATADGGKTNRIVAQAAAGSFTTLPRQVADYVVTEHGIADLRARSVHDRAQALIQIAAPQFRDALSLKWRDMARLL